VVDVPFEFEVREGEFVTMTAKPPTSGQLAMMVLTNTSPKMTDRIRGMFDFLAAVLDQKDYDIIEEQLHEGMDVDVLAEIVDYIVGEWGARPTKPSSDSASSRRNTGRRSTAKQRAVVSISSP